MISFVESKAVCNAIDTICLLDLQYNQPPGRNINGRSLPIRSRDPFIMLSIQCGFWMNKCRQNQVE